MEKFLKRFFIWRMKHVSDKQLMLILSVIVGLGVGLVAFIIKKSVFVIQLLLTKGFSENVQNYLYIIYPAIGITLVILFIKYIL